MNMPDAQPNSLHPVQYMQVAFEEFRKEFEAGRKTIGRPVNRLTAQ